MSPELSSIAIARVFEDLPGEHIPINEYTASAVVVIFIGFIATLLWLSLYYNIGAGSREITYPPPNVGDIVTIDDKALPMQFLVQAVDESEECLEGDLIFTLPAGSQVLGIQRFFSADDFITKVGFCLTYQAGNQARTATWDFVGEEDRLAYQGWWLNVKEIIAEVEVQS